MSVEAMAIVLHHSQQTGTRKLLLVGIANHDGDGGAWPTIETLAKYANTDERNVRRRLTEIVESGELAIHYNAGGNFRTADYERPNLYEILITCPPNCDGSRNHRLLPLAAVQGGEGSTTSPPTPEVGGGRMTPGGEGSTTPPPPGPSTPPGGGRTTPQTVLEPSSNRPSNRPGGAARPAPSTPSPASPPTKATRLPEDWTPSPADLSAVQADAPDVDHDLHLRQFRDYWLSVPGQKGVKTRWGLVYRVWMRREQAKVRPPAANGHVRPPAASVTQLGIGLDGMARAAARQAARDAAARDPQPALFPSATPPPERITR